MYCVLHFLFGLLDSAYTQVGSAVIKFSAFSFCLSLSFSRPFSVLSSVVSCNFLKAEFLLRVLSCLQKLKHCFPTYDVEGKKEFRAASLTILQDMCDKQLITKECLIRAGSVLNVPEGHRYAFLPSPTWRIPQSRRCTAMLIIWVKECVFITVYHGPKLLNSTFGICTFYPWPASAALTA